MGVQDRERENKKLYFTKKGQGRTLRQDSRLVASLLSYLLSSIGDFLCETEK